MTIIPLRHCNKCGNDWPSTLEYFLADSRASSGFRAPCKQCIKEYRRSPTQKENIQVSAKKHYQANAEKIKQYARAYHHEHREEIVTAKRQCYALHQEEHRQRSRKYHAEHREERRQYNRRYRVLHREEMRQKNQQYSRQYYAIHPEKFRQKGHRYYARHRDEKRLYGRQYHYSHRERRLLYSRWYDATHKEHKRRYELAHKERRLDYSRSYRNQHREEVRTIVRQRRARQRAMPGTLTSHQVIEKLKQQHYRCYYAACGFAKFEKRGDQYVFHVEHTVPVSRTEASPRHDINFVVLACPSCNHRKNAKLPHEWPEGGRLL